MKKLFHIIFFLTTTVQAQTSEIVLLPLDTPREEIPLRKVDRMFYLKDELNKLGYFEGVWEYENTGKKIVLKIGRKGKVLNNLNIRKTYYEDILVFQYKVEIIDSVIYNGIGKEEKDLELLGLYFKDNSYYIKYFDSLKCGIKGDVKMRVDEKNKNLLHWEMEKTTTLPVLNKACSPFKDEMTLPYTMSLRKQKP